MNDFFIAITRVIKKANFSRSVVSLGIPSVIYRLLLRSTEKQQKIEGVSFLLQFRDCNRKISNNKNSDDLLLPVFFFSEDLT